MCRQMMSDKSNSIIILSKLNVIGMDTVPRGIYISSKYIYV